MCNKEQIKKLRDYAELSWASYGYFHYFLEQQKKSYFMLLQDKDGNILKNQDDTPLTQTIEIKHILNGEYKKYNIAEYDHHIKKYITIGTLKGDFNPLQAQRFFSRYELVHHIPNAFSGYSSSVFFDTDNKNYILAFRGTEAKGVEIIKDVLIADTFLALTGRAITQIEAMNDFATDIFQAIIAHHQKSSNINLNNPNLESKDIA